MAFSYNNNLVATFEWQTPSERRHGAAAEVTRVLKPYLLVVLIPLVNEYGGPCSCDPIALLWGRTSQRGDLRCFTCQRYYCWACMATCSGAIIPSHRSSSITAMRQWRQHRQGEPPAESLADRDATTCTRRCCPECRPTWKPYDNAVLCCVRSSGATHDTGISDAV